jgi:hypothetical protein
VGLYEMGIELIPAKDKRWVEQQKQDLINKVDDARTTVRHSAVGVAFSLLVLSGTIVGGAYLIRDK